MRRIQFLVAISAALFLNQNVSAGANVYHENWDRPEECSGWEYDGYSYSYCNTEKGIWHRTDTPSGNTAYHGKTADSWVIKQSAGGYSDSESGEYNRKFNILIKHGETHVYSSRYTRVVESQNSNGYCFVLSWDQQIHFTDGEVKVDKSNFTSEPC